MSTPLPCSRTLALAALALAAISCTARAADLDEFREPPHRPGVEVPGREAEDETLPDAPPHLPRLHAFVRGHEGGPEEVCRVFVKRRPGPFGDEVRRVRVCDEEPVPARFGPRWRHGWHHPRFNREGPRERVGERPPLPPEIVPGE